MASNSCLEWLLPDNGAPVYKLAAKVLKGYSGEIPVRIFELAEQRATVDFVDWDHECDALVHGLTTAKPGILLRALKPNYGRRMRMTVGHELGHIVIPWHVGTITCDGLTEIVEPAGGSALPLSFRGQESEATAFSSAVLVPYYSLVQDATDNGLDEFFQGLDRYEVSAQATVIRIKELLRPGFVFRGNYGWGLEEDVSGGTQRPPSSVNRAQQLLDAAHESGQFEVGGKQIFWYRLASDEEFVPVADPRTATQLLRDAVAIDRSAPEIQSDRMLSVVNGVVSGALGKIRFRTETEALSHVRQWTAHSEAIPSEVKAAPEFDLYLRRKVEQRLKKLREQGHLG